jgi:hypothetical protein
MVERGDLAALPATNRPYPPPSNVIAILQRIRSRNLPERIDADYLRDAGTPEGTVNRVLFALRFLGLIEGDSPSAALRGIATSTDEEYREALAGVLRERYREVFQAVDPAQDSQDRIVNVFRRFTPGSQRERMVIFFLGMCREAGIPTLDVPRQRSTVISSPGRRPTRTATAAPRTIGANGDMTPRRQRVTAHGVEEAPRGVSGYGGAVLAPALELLVRSLPPVGSPMTKERREQWLQMARATLAFVYPEEPPPASESGFGDSESGFGDEEGDEGDDEAEHGFQARP